MTRTLAVSTRCIRSAALALLAGALFASATTSAGERVAAADVPSPVLATLERVLPGAEIVRIEREDEGRRYELEVRHEGRRYEVEIAADGVLREVDLDD